LILDTPNFGDTIHHERGALSEGTVRCQNRQDDNLGNPYSHKEGTLAKYHCETRQESIEKYKEYILNTPELLNRIPELQGKILGCWCKPKACHGDFLAELANKKVDLENI
tara:strand:- start:1913 stop:2242 length:330 start_codon:yes stop_codon:yes gene_type:complete